MPIFRDAGQRRNALKLTAFFVEEGGYGRYVGHAGEWTSHTNSYTKTDLKIHSTANGILSQSCCGEFYEATKQLWFPCFL